MMTRQQYICISLSSSPTQQHGNKEICCNLSTKESRSKRMLKLSRHTSLLEIRVLLGVRAATSPKDHKRKKSYQVRDCRSVRLKKKWELLFKKIILNCFTRLCLPFLGSCGPTRTSEGRSLCLSLQTRLFLGRCWRSRRLKFP